MGFLFKLAIVLAIAVMFVPLDPHDIAPGTSTSPVITAAEAMTVAEAAWSDMGGFCTRNPDACSSGGRFLVTFGYKARTGAQMLASLVDRHLPATGANAGANAGAGAGAANVPGVAVPVHVAAPPHVSGLPHVPAPPLVSAPADSAVTSSIRPPSRHPLRQWLHQTLSAADRRAPWQGMAMRLD